MRLAGYTCFNSLFKTVRFIFPLLLKYSSSFPYYPSKHDTSTQCLTNVGPTFYDIAQIQRCPQISKLSLNKSLNSSDREGQINLCQIRLIFSSLNHLQLI